MKTISIWKALLLLITIFLHLQLSSQETRDYRISFDKQGMGSGAIKVGCSFTIEFQDKDSIVLDFGGPLLDDSVVALNVMPSSIKYTFIPEKREIVFYNSGKRKQRVQMSYEYLNLTSVLMYADSGSEIWEYIYTGSGEFYYPMKRGKRYSGKVQYLVPDSLIVIASCLQSDTKWNKIHQCVPLNFAFLDKEQYVRQTIGEQGQYDIYQLTSNQTSAIRLNELANLTSKAIEWFENKFQDPYINSMFGTYDYPTFVFHNGNRSFNRYNMGFISASQDKFSTYPDIYPLIHEIGHRWFGEYSMFIDEGQKGYAFIIETLNEFMTLMCIRDIVGTEEYDRIIETYAEQWNRIKGTETDIHPLDVTKNNNMIVTYRKGPVIIDRVARVLGYDKVIESIISVYNQLSGHPNMNVSDFEKIFDNIL